ncbi:hypothetical protein HDU85_001696 [Gaertneriomyces sp. JEL0708]|nr:hypothetical protein HDU85_001696 [Gaertneriomyces sp. JEL0708]
MAIASPPSPNTSNILYLRIPRDHDHVSLRQNLLATVQGISRAFFAPKNLFLIFPSERKASRAMEAINDSIGLTAEYARTELPKHVNGLSRMLYDNEPSAGLLLSFPRFFTRELIERLLSEFEGYETINGRTARFKDAFHAMEAMTTLNTTTNIHADFARWPEGEDEEAVILSRTKDIKGHPECFLVEGAPRRSRFYSMMSLLRLFMHYRGFAKISYQPGGVCFLDFEDAASTKAAIARIRATTPLRIKPATGRPPNPGHLPLLRPCSSIFVRVEPFMNAKDVTALFEVMDGFKSIRFPTENYCIVDFKSVNYAQQAVEELRHQTNLVVNFAKRGERNPNLPSTGNPAEDEQLHQQFQQQQHEQQPGDLPGVRVRNIPIGANPKELFAIYEGFRHLICDDDGSLVGLYESMGNAKAALSELRRSLSNEPKFTYASAPRPYRAREMGPSTVLYIGLHPSLTDGQYKRLLSSYTGFVDFKAMATSSGDRFALVQFACMNDSQKALEDLLFTTNLNVNYSKRGDTALDRDAGRRSGREFSSSHPSLGSGASSRESLISGGEAGDSGNSNPRATLHLASLPHNKVQLKNVLVTDLNAQRVVFKRILRHGGAEYCFVIFSNIEEATQALPRILARWPGISGSFAKHEYVAESPRSTTALEGALKHGENGTRTAGSTLMRRPSAVGRACVDVQGTTGSEPQTSRIVGN